ncbi:MAG: DUF3109 family protein [Bacteroidota bacterium]|nr:DUF3109 family protein [Bacteroidota bacterium]
MRIDSKILSTRFACDLAACKGACCTFPGGSGAPVLAEETETLRQAWKEVSHRVPEAHRDEVRRLGLFVHDGEELTLRCHDDRACVFVFYDGDVAKCAIQQAFHEGTFHWPKPESCHLFPIRVRGRKRDQLRFETFSECAPAFTVGEAEKLPLVAFLKDALRRAFGDAFYVGLLRHTEEMAADDGGEID